VTETELLAPPAPTALWSTAAAAAHWLAETNGHGDHETAMQIMKITEEAGEVTSAYIGMTGQNPRKGTTHTAGDVVAELCDVILAAATALHRFTGEPATALDAHATRVGHRITDLAGSRATVDPAVPECGWRLGLCTGCPKCTPEPDFGGEGCTCRPFTHKGGSRYLDQPGDTVDMICGWETGDCPHHKRRTTPAVGEQPHA
jgi:hypothetical protein